VPVGYFEEVGKQVRKSTAHSATDRSSTTGGHDSGYSEQNSADGRNGTGTNGHAGMRGGPGKGGAAMIYGMVLYDFKAERTDELDARAGEPIIVVAQSNNEWFVAKPITRLGGPGLIPVSFIEIRDSATQKPVEDTLAAVQRAGVPKVEEWKKMAADYKNSSIPLGRLDSSHQKAPVEQMERLSVASSGPRPSHDKSRHGSDVSHRNFIFPPKRDRRPNIYGTNSSRHDHGSPALSSIHNLLFELRK
jgi:bud emergence protein 1